MLEIDLLVQLDQGGVIQLVRHLIEDAVDFWRQRRFAYQRDNVLAWLFVFIILQYNPILFCERSLGGYHRCHIYFSGVQRQAGQRPAHIEGFHLFKLQTVDAL